MDTYFLCLGILWFMKIKEEFLQTVVIVVIVFVDVRFVFKLHKIYFISSCTNG